LRACLEPVGRSVIDLAARAVALGRVRLGHEATLARVEREARATELVRAARAELARVAGDLEQVRAVLVTIGPSVRHLALLVRTEEIGVAWEAPLELEARVSALREALAEELTHAAA
jgi:hypothetical protein